MIMGTRVQLAQKILNQVEKYMPKRSELWLESYANGREQGLSLFNVESKKVSFGESRNTDQIVIYTGMYSDFSMQGNTPNDKVYHNARYFDLDKIVESAQFIIEYFNAP